MNFAKAWKWSKLLWNRLISQTLYGRMILLFVIIEIV